MIKDSKFQQYGLAEPVKEYSLEELIETANIISSNDSERDISDIAEITNSNNNLVSSLNEVEDRTDSIAEDNLPGLESIKFALNVLLKSHGANIENCSTESYETLVKDDIIANTQSAKQFIEKDYKTTMEDYGSEIMQDLNRKKHLINHSRHTLEKSLQEIRKNKDNIKKYGVNINYHGIYDFLMFRNSVVTQPTLALKNDMDVISRIKEIIDDLGKDIKDVATWNPSGGEKAFEYLINDVRGLNIGRRSSGVAGSYLLNNRKITLDSWNFETREGHRTRCEYIEIYEIDIKNDNSEASSDERIKGGFYGGLTGAGIGAVAGGLIGFIVGGPGGALVGASLGGTVGTGVGTYKGVKNADYEYRGSNTNVNISYEEMESFIKISIDMLKEAEEVGNTLDRSLNDLYRFRRHVEDVITKVDNNALLVFILNILVQYNYQVQKQKEEKQTGHSTTRQPERIRTHKEIVTEVLNHNFKAVEFGYLSLVDVLIDHVFVCVKNSMEIANRLANTR